MKYLLSLLFSLSLISQVYAKDIDIYDYQVTDKVLLVVEVRECTQFKEENPKVILMEAYAVDAATGAQAVGCAVDAEEYIEIHLKNPTDNKYYDFRFKKSLFHKRVDI